MNRISKEKEDILIQAFLDGKSEREAAKLAGMNKGTAARAKKRFGGMQAFRALGATFKMNRWDGSRK